MTTKQKIIKIAVTLYADQGYNGFNLRHVADRLGIAVSVLYHYFNSKDQLLETMFDETNRHLGIERKKIPQAGSTEAMLYQRIEFQLDHAKEIISVLKYYLAYRQKFKKLPVGFVPEKAYLHIQEVLQFGIERKEIDPDTNIQEDAKVMTHAINGFLLEYFPHIPKGEEKKQLILSIQRFLLRGMQWNKNRY